MPDGTARAIQLELALPEPPDAAPFLAGVEARLTAITELALPPVRDNRTFLENFWRSGRRDAVPVFINPKNPILCDPVGADRVATAAATEAALLAEQVALSDLARAIRLYAVGGRLIAAQLGLDDDLGDNQESRSQPCATREAHAGPGAQRGMLRRLRAYLALIRRERKLTAIAGHAEQAAALDTEYEVVRSRLEQVDRGRHGPQQCRSDAGQDAGRKRTRRIA